MKIKNMAAVLLLIWTCGSSSVVSAAEIHTVQLTEENQLVYTKDKAELAGAFDGMAPGDSRTVVIKIENQNSHKASFLFRRRQRMLWKKQEKRLAEHMSFRWRSAMIPEGYLCWMQMPVDMRKMWQVPKV